MLINEGQQQQKFVHHLQFNKVKMEESGARHFRDFIPEAAASTKCVKLHLTSSPDQAKLNFLPFPPKLTKWCLQNAKGEKLGEFYF